MLLRLCATGLGAIAVDRSRGDIGAVGQLRDICLERAVVILMGIKVVDIER